MALDTPVSEIMATDVMTFSPEDEVQAAIRALIDRGYNGAPVVDRTGQLVGMLTATDLIVQGVRLHFPTIVNFLGVNIEIPSLKDIHIHEDVEKLLGGHVRDVMHAPVRSIAEDATVQDAATVMHDEDLSRLPVVDADGALRGLVTRKDILRALVS